MYLSLFAIFAGLFDTPSECSMHVRLYYVVFSDIEKIIAQIRAKGWVSFTLLIKSLLFFNHAN
jgi:hypothetical protein